MQNDWNGSAKVALLSVVRSERGWRSLAAASGDDGAAALADLLANLRQHITREFPRAMDFHRPGFDAKPDVGEADSPALGTMRANPAGERLF